MKNSRRVQMTQTLLKESLTELLEQQNIHQITIKELCERANVSRSTFYSYYGSQYELLNAIEKEIIEETQKLASKMTSHDEENTRRLLEAHFRYTLEHIRFLRAFSTNGSEDYMLPKRTMQIILLPYIDHRLMQRRPPRLGAGVRAYLPVLHFRLHLHREKLGAAVNADAAAGAGG